LYSFPFHACRVHQMSSSWWMPMILGKCSTLWIVETAHYFSSAWSHRSSVLVPRSSIFFCHSVYLGNMTDNKYECMIGGVNLRHIRLNLSPRLIRYNIFLLQQNSISWLINHKNHEPNSSKGMHRYWNYCGNNPATRTWSATLPVCV